MSSRGNPAASELSGKVLAPCVGTWPRPSTVWKAMTVWKMSRASARTASGVIAFGPAFAGHAIRTAPAITADVTRLARTHRHRLPPRPRPWGADCIRPRTLGMRRPRRSSRPRGVGRRVAHELDARAVERQHVDLAAQDPLDRPQAVALVARHQRQRVALAAGAAGAADAVHVVLGHVRQLVVDDVRQLADVEAACRDVGRDQHLHLVVLEVRERLGARVLRLVAVDGRAVDAVAGELVGEPVRAVLGAREDQRLRRRAFAQQVAQHGALLALLDQVHAVLDELGGRVARRHLDGERIVQQAVRERADLLAGTSPRRAGSAASSAARRARGGCRG